MAAIANGLVERGIATLRYQFPYMEQGAKRPGCFRRPTRKGEVRPLADHLGFRAGPLLTTRVSHGAEKIWHALTGHEEKGPQQAQTIDAAHLKEQRVKGAIKTDFILSAEIMTIALSTIDVDDLWTRAAVLGVIAVLFTVLVYGTVALLVKVDDIGLYMSKAATLRSVRALGRWLVIAMPTVLKLISIVGTAAMLWVGGSIVIHSLHTMHLSWPYDTITSIVSAVSAESTPGAIVWLVTAFLDAVFGFLLGLVLMPVVNMLLPSRP
jgi:predicted DNA repair protein MutK